MAAALVGPAPRRHLAYVCFFRGGDLRSFPSSERLALRPASHVRDDSIVFFCASGNLAERFADRRIIEQWIVAEAIFTAKRCAISPRTSPSTTILRRREE